jgi:hypothetical protein
MDVNDFMCQVSVKPAMDADHVLPLWLGAQLFEDRDRLCRLGPIAIVDTDVGAPNDGMLIDDKRRR